MHRTSSTKLSESVALLTQFGERLDDARWMPIEELLGMLAAGTTVMEAIFDNTDPMMFSEDEQTFIENLHERIVDHINEIQTSENYD